MTDAISFESTTATQAAVIDVAVDLREVAHRIRQRVRRATADIIENGRDLLRVKQHLAHGAFLDWIDREFAMSNRTAERWTRLATFAEDKIDTVSILPPAIAYQLSAKSTPVELAEKIISDVKRGAVDLYLIEGQLGTARGEARIEQRNKRSALRRKRTMSAQHDHQLREADERASRDCVEVAAQEIVAALGIDKARRIVALLTGARLAQLGCALAEAVEGRS